MLDKLRTHVRTHVVGYIALFVALGGTAYATHPGGANTISSIDIINGEVKTPDIGTSAVTNTKLATGAVQNPKIAHAAVNSSKVLNNSLTGADIADESIGVDDIGSQQVGPDEVINDSLLQSDIRAGAVTNDEVLNNSLIGADINDNSLTGADINESTLNMPPTTTATFAGAGAVVAGTDSFAKIVSKNLPAGSWAVLATANARGSNLASDHVRSLDCELRNGTGFIGGAQDRSFSPANQIIRMSLTLNGGAQVPSGGGEVSLWCSSQGGSHVIDNSQIMMIRLDGFS